MRLTRPGARTRPRTVTHAVGRLDGRDIRVSTSARCETGSMGRIQDSWYLAKLSWRVLRSDRTLAVFPVLSAVGVADRDRGLRAASSPSPASTTTTGGRPAADRLGVRRRRVPRARVRARRTSRPASWPAPNERLDGKRHVGRHALAAANASAPAAAVGARAGDRVDRPPGDRGAPGLPRSDHRRAVRRGVGRRHVPRRSRSSCSRTSGRGDALKRSGTLLKQTWGENIVAQVGLRACSAFVAALPGVVVIAIGVATGSVVAAVAARRRRRDLDRHRRGRSSPR